MKKLALGLALVAAPALAQNSNTTCSRVGQFVNCQTTTQPQPPSGVPDYLGAMHVLPDPNAWARGQQDAERLRAQQLQNQIEALRLADAQREAQDRQSAQAAANAVVEGVADRLNAGDCPGALSLALRSGNIPLATQVKGFCAKP